jgi:hypothetical protein
MTYIEPDTRDVRWLLAYNNSAEEVPPYALVELLGTQDTQDGSPVWDIDKPSATAEADQNPRMLAVNGPTPIPAGQIGTITQDWPALVLHDSTDTDLIAGGTCGAKEDSWAAWSTGTAFTCQSYDATLPAAYFASGMEGVWVGALPPATGPKYGKLDGVWQSGTVTVSIWANGADTGENLEDVAMPPWLTAESSWNLYETWVRLDYFSCDSKWYATPFVSVNVPTGFHINLETHGLDWETRTIMLPAVLDPAAFEELLSFTMVTLLCDHQVDTANKKLQNKFQTVYVWSADAEGSWEDEHVGAICT